MPTNAVALGHNQPYISIFTGKVILSLLLFLEYKYTGMLFLLLL